MVKPDFFFHVSEKQINRKTVSGFWKMSGKDVLIEQIDANAYVLCKIMYKGDSDDIVASDKDVEPLTVTVSATEKQIEELSKALEESHRNAKQVNAAGDLCAICQEKMHAPIFLSCKHIFCEDCVAEWFERERTCPLCRALVRPADIKSYGDGSTSLLFQLF
ncbi:hypothetical protein POM88_052970 [Heracleum sosnowskyi]|uniref:RING-type domain-containing protein n=1 Tax=Heracleum sosnowskyi TaxID=360622 RepID=A0AAD8LYI2_9APIA|nr:hypothetical protein POM88_052970 [Heracleum sosnowskyi]